MNATQLLAHFDRLAEAPGAVQRLLRFILDLAVRGKLVAQEAGDEPAAELLKRIQVERMKLVKAGKFKEGKAPANILGDLPANQLPANWSWVPFGATVNTHLGGGTPSKANSTYWNGEILWASVKDVGKTKYLDSTIDSITEAGLADSSSNLIEPGNLIVVTRMGLGKVSINRVPVAINQDLRALSLSSLMSIDYCYIYFKTHGFEGSGLTVKGIKIEELLGIAFPLPPLAEQHRIVAKVDELMALCDQLEAAQLERERRRDRLATASLQRLNRPAADATPEIQREHAHFHLQHLPRLTTRPEHIKAMRQTIRKLAITGQITRQEKNDEPASELLIKNQHWRAVAIKHKQIRDPRKELLAIGGDDTPYPLPKQWSWARLGEVIYIQSGDGLISANMKDGSIPVFGGNGVNGHHDAFNIDKPTLVIGRVGYYCGSIHVTPDRAWVTDNAFVTHFCPDLFSLRFLALLLATTNLKENEGATAQPVISGSKIYPLIVGIPPMAEQHRIVAKVDALMALCDQLEAQLTTTQTDSRRLLEAALEAALVLS